MVDYVMLMNKSMKIYNQLMYLLLYFKTLHYIFVNTFELHLG